MKQQMTIIHDLQLACAPWRRARPLGGRMALGLAALSFSLLPSAMAQPSPSTYGDYALAHDGDAERGARLFASQEVLACAQCHSVDGSSSKAGPDLFAVGGKFPRRELIRSILEPSSTIAVGYATTILETSAGESVQGILKEAGPEAWELMGADGLPTRVNVADIVSRQTSAVSLMPEGLHQAITPEQFADLIAYLETLRQVERRPAGTPALPDPIPRSARPVGFEPLFRSNIEFSRPLWFGPLPHQPNRFVVLEHHGQAWLVERSAQGDRQITLLDLSGVVRVGGASGLLGFAFHPRFPDNRLYYLKYQVVEQGTISTVVEERQFREDFLGDSGKAPRQLLQIPSVTQDHNGGCIEFGPDGYLYVGMGDTGPQRDPQGHGQDMKLFLGKILRLDVDHPTPDRPYAIPPDNPFLNTPEARPEIWAAGFREPWRFTFDPANGDLWVGDVGQDRFEEVAIVRAGENHGWNVYEGFNDFSNRHRRDDQTYIPPVFDYPHRLGVSVTGGYVYRGHRAPALRGWYVFGDFETRRLWALTQTGRRVDRILEIGRAPSRVASFAQDHDGELYLVGYDDGEIYRLNLAQVDPRPLAMQVLVETSETNPVTWRYTEETPGEDWFQPGFDDSRWKMGPGGFGTHGTPGAVVRTVWNGRSIWLRRDFQLTAWNPSIPPESLALRLHHDEDAEIYLNGVRAAEVSRWTSGYIEIPILRESVAALRPGRNVLAIRCRQNNGGQYIDAGLVAYR